MNQKIARREFLKSSFRAGLAVSGLGLLSNVALSAEPFKRCGSARFHLSICAYSFRGAFASKDPARKMDMFSFIDYAADHGCDGVELTSYYFPKDADAAYLRKVRRHAFLRNIAISGTAAGNDFTVPAGEKLNKQIADVKKLIDKAVILGAPFIRVFAGYSKETDQEQGTKNCIAALQECCEYAGQNGVVLGLENHHGIVDRAEQIISIVQTVKSEWLGVTLDTGNFQTADPYADLAKVAPYAVNVHFKGYIRPNGQKEMIPADMPRMFQILRDANYQGYCALEYELPEDPSTGVPKMLSRMRELIRAES